MIHGATPGRLSHAELSERPWDLSDEMYASLADHSMSRLLRARLSFHESPTSEVAKMKVIEEHLSSSSEKFQSDRQNWPFRMRICIGAFFLRACGTRVESPGDIAVEGST